MKDYQSAKDVLLSRLQRKTEDFFPVCLSDAAQFIVNVDVAVDHVIAAQSPRGRLSFAIVY